MPTRRNFLGATAASLIALPAVTYAGAADKPNDRVLLAVMGVRGRGKDLIKAFGAFDNVEITTVCEVDDAVVPPALSTLAAKQKTAARVEKDVRRVLEDRSLTALVVAAPDHWHAPATVWACQAGKHVYVEKPCSHNLREGRLMVEAARKHKRVVQMGVQRRSASQFQSAREFVRSGKLGKIPFVRTWIAGNRPNIGKKPDGPVPAGVDYDLWLGPAAQRPFNPNRFHYNWHWHWDYGTGELGNNGVHALDCARMVAGLDTPHRITAGGGKYFYEDDQQTPDTHLVTYDFPGTCVVWEHRIWSKTGIEGEPWGVTLYGEKGTLLFDRKGWHVIDGVEASDKTGPDMQKVHLQNFLDAIAKGSSLNAEIEEGHKTTSMCHLGNIALRTNKVLNFDAKAETVDDPAANALLSRTYRKGFEIS